VLCPERARRLTRISGERSRRLPQRDQLLGTVADQVGAPHPPQRLP
jgi:hypothetical protein